MIPYIKQITFRLEKVNIQNMCSQLLCSHMHQYKQFTVNYNSNGILDAHPSVFGRLYGQFKYLVYMAACVTSFRPYSSRRSRDELCLYPSGSVKFVENEAKLPPKRVALGGGGGEVQIQTLCAKRQPICCPTNAPGTYYTVWTKHTCTCILTVIYSFSAENYLLIFTNICKKLHSCMHVTGGKEIPL